MKKLLSLLFIFTLCLQLTACNYFFEPYSEETTQSQSTTTRTTTKFISGSSYKAIDPSNYIIYNKLTTPQKRIYSTIEKAVYNMEDSVKIGKYSEKDISVAYNAVMNDYPQYFWMAKAYMYSYLGDYYTVYFRKASGGTNYDYNILKADKNKMQEALYKRVNIALGKISKGMSEYEIELVLHDFIVSNVKYDTAELTDKADSNNLSYTAYGALVDGKAVCEGFSRAFQLLLYYAGIENSLVIGTSKDIGHMWNIVKINGKWVHTDTTFDNSEGNIYHTYFNVSDKYIEVDHNISDENIDLPACNTMEYNFGVVNHTYITSDDTFKTVILNGLKNNIPVGINEIEFNFSENYSRVFPNDLDAFIKDSIEPIVLTYNKGRIKKARISGFIIVGGKGSKGFMFKKSN